MVLLGLGAYELRVEEMDSMRVAKLKLTKLPAGGTEFMKKSGTEEGSNGAKSQGH